MLSATDLAYRISQGAETEARWLGWQQIIAEHILLALLAKAENDNSLIRRVLDDTDITPEEAREAVKAVVPQGDLLPHVPHESTKPLPVSSSGMAVFEQADNEQMQLGHKFSSTGHILLGILNTGNSATTVLNNLGLHYGATREYLRPLLDEIDEKETRMTEQLCGRCSNDTVSEDPERIVKVDNKPVRVCDTCWWTR